MTGTPDSAIVALARMTDTYTAGRGENDVQMRCHWRTEEELRRAEPARRSLRQRFHSVRCTWLTIQMRISTATITYDEVATEVAREAAAETVDVIYANQTASRRVMVTEDNSRRAAPGAWRRMRTTRRMHAAVLLLVPGTRISRSISSKPACWTRKLMVLATIIGWLSAMVPLTGSHPRILPALSARRRGSWSRRRALGLQRLAVVSHICSWNTGIPVETR